VSDGRERPLNGAEVLGLRSDVSPGNDSPLSGSDELVEGAPVLPEEEPDPLVVGDVGVVTLGSATPVAGNVGTAISGTPMSPSGMNGSAKGALTAGVPLPDADDPLVGTVGTVTNGALKRCSDTGSESPAPIDSDGNAAATG
jgi:hypothetical protein